MKNPRPQQLRIFCYYMLLDFVRAFYELAPVVLQRIGVLESLPRTAAVRAVDDR